MTSDFTRVKLVGETGEALCELRQGDTKERRTSVGIFGTRDGHYR